MNQISAPVRVLALVGVLAALAMGAWMMTQGGAGGPEAVDETYVRPVQQAKSVASKLTSRNKSTAAGQPSSSAGAGAAAKPSAATTSKAAVTPAVAKPAPAKLELPEGTPTTIAGQLARHQIVVVLLYDPKSKVDAYSLAEAQLGAREAKAGFLSVNVLNQKQASPFANAYGVLQDPTVLFFKRPGKLALKLSGFADHETIAQAAANAARGLVSVSS